MPAKRTLKNLLVTGGAGFIGSAFIRHALAKPEYEGTIVNLDLLTYAGNLENLASVEKDRRYVFQQGDIRNQALVEHLCREHAIDAIVHFAAESHVDRSIVSPQAFIDTNVLGTFHLLEVARRIPGMHFHHVSTDEVYGCLGDEGFFTEETPYHPNSPYSASKASSDHLVRAYHKTYGLSACISNCSNNYGPYHFPEKLIPLMILNCLQGKPLPIYGAGKNVRDWLYVDDHAEAIWQLLQKGAKGETYNIGGEQEWKNIDIVHLIIEKVGLLSGLDKLKLQELITYVKDRPGHDFRYAIDCSKIKKEIGWQPSRSFADKITETVQWYIDNRAWVDRVQSGAYRTWLETNYSKR